MRVVVTRPAAEGQVWSQALRLAGFDAISLPLIAIAPLAADGRQALCERWRSLADYRAVMFVSASAVQHFFDAAPADWHWPAGTRAWSPGPGTSAVLRGRGLAETFIDAPAADAAQLDSESLWDAAGHAVAPGDAVLLVRGARQSQDDATGSGHGRAWMSERLVQAGARVDAMAAYRRGAPEWSAAQAAEAAALARPDTVWLFSNSEAVEHLFDLLPANAPAMRQGIALATHPRIAAAASAAGFAHTQVAPPGMQGVVSALRGLDRSIESTA